MINTLVKLVCTITLTVSTAFAPYPSQALSITAPEEARETLWVDGIEFEIELNDDNGITVKPTSNAHSECFLSIDANGTGEMVAENENGKAESYDVQIEKLTDSEMTATIEKEGEPSTVITEENLFPDEYTGQAVAVPVVVVGADVLLQVLIAATAVVIVGSVTYFAATALTNQLAKNKHKNKRDYFHKARIINGQVYINAKTISRKTATQLASKGQSFYVYNKKLAYAAIAALGRGVTKEEITSAKNRIKGRAYYWHYHPKKRNGSHGFYGNAVIGKVSKF